MRPRRYTHGAHFALLTSKKCSRPAKNETHTGIQNPKKLSMFKIKSGINTMQTCNTTHRLQSESSEKLKVKKSLKTVQVTRMKMCAFFPPSLRPELLDWIRVKSWFWFYGGFDGRTSPSSCPLQCCTLKKQAYDDDVEWWWWWRKWAGFQWYVYFRLLHTQNFLFSPTNRWAQRDEVSVGGRKSGDAGRHETFSSNSHPTNFRGEQLTDMDLEIRYESYR